VVPSNSFLHAGAREYVFSLSFADIRPIKFAATRMQRKKNAVLSRDFGSKVVGSKRAPAINPCRQNPDPSFRLKQQFLEVVCGSKPTFAMVYRDLASARKSL